MPPKQGVTVRRQRLRVELRAERERARLTQAQVAEAMDWSLSKLIRIENGAVGISTNDLKALLELYTVTDPGRIEVITSLAKAFREREWWAGYSGVIGREYQNFIGLESDARMLRYFAPLVMPGLLQTPEYARVIFQELTFVDRSEDEVNRLVEVRMRRQQEMFSRPAVPFVLSVIDEAVLRRVVGDADIMRRQLQHLLELKERPEVITKVIPFSVGAHVGMRGPFTIMEFPDPADADLLYFENINGEMTNRGDRPDELRPFREAFELLWGEISLDEKDSAALIERIANELT